MPRSSRWNSLLVKTLKKSRPPKRVWKFVLVKGFHCGEMTPPPLQGRLRGGGWFCHGTCSNTWFWIYFSSERASAGFSRHVTQSYTNKAQLLPIIILAGEPYRVLITQHIYWYTLPFFLRREKNQTGSAQLVTVLFPGESGVRKSSDNW